MLATKPAARKLLEELRTLSATLKSLPRQKLGEDLSEIVLRMAERRMLTEPADTEIEEKMGTGSAEVPVPMLSEPGPIYSTILRRLKNPRIWVWEIVIVAVAVLLVVYYPNRNANLNAPQPGNAERNIAMATKPAEKQASSEHGGIPAAPAPATVNQEESLGVQIVRGKQSDTSGQSGFAVSGKQPKAPDEAPASRKAGEEASKTDASWQLKVVEKTAEGKSAAAPENLARDRADLTKKQGETTGDKIAGEDMPKTALKTAANGAPAAESPAPIPSPASGLTVLGQPQPGADRAAETAIASKSLAQIKPAEPAEGRPAEQPKSPAASADRVLVVRCEITPEALKNHAFDKILADNAIVWRETRKESQKENLDLEILPKPESIQSLLDTKTDRTAIKPEGEELSKVARENIADSKAGPVELVYVEASPAQIQAMLKGISAQTEAFKSISITQAIGDFRLKNAVEGVASRRGITMGGRGARANAGQTAASAEDHAQSQLKSDFYASENTVLGRAERIPFSYGDNTKAAGVETEAQKQKSVNIAQKGLPGAMGGMSAGKSGEANSEGRFGGAAGGAPPAGSIAAEQLKSPSQVINQPPAKAVQVPASASVSPSLSQQGQAQAAKQEVQSAPAAQDRQSTKLEQQPAQAGQNRQDADSLYGNFQTQPSGSAGFPRMERVLFVFQVMERKNAGEDSDKSAPANPARVNTPAVDANPSKP